MYVGKPNQDGQALQLLGTVLHGPVGHLVSETLGFLAGSPGIAVDSLVFVVDLCVPK